MKPQKLIFTIALSFIWYSTILAQQADTSEVIKKIEYTCSMHPEVISSSPGFCSKCGMKLIEKNTQIRTENLVQTYTCSMHPEIISDKPGKCPKCGMNLILKGDSSAKHMGCMGMMDDEKAHPKRAMFVVGGIIMVAMMTVAMLFAFR